MRYIAMRVCSTCKRSFEYPLAEGWTIVGQLWRCPECTEREAA